MVIIISKEIGIILSFPVKIGLMLVKKCSSKKNSKIGKIPPKKIDKKIIQLNFFKKLSLNINLFFIIIIFKGFFHPTPANFII